MGQRALDSRWGSVIQQAWAEREGVRFGEKFGTVLSRSSCKRVSIFFGMRLRRGNGDM
jgi:hypothetical protein